MYRSRILGWMISVAATSTAALSSPFCTDPGPPGPRLVVVISDLHFGVGLDDDTGAPHKFEDFRWGADFEAFLDDIDRRGDGKTTLVFNGDTFELWQSLSDDCQPPAKDQSCSEAEALERLERVLTQHSRELALLGSFAAPENDNRVVLIPGNHDAALLFEKVATRTLTEIGASDGRVCIAREGYWASPDGLIFAEHGHQIGDDVNAFDDWPEPFLGPASERRLQKTWGEAFVADYYDPYELKYPAIDNITEEGIGVVYGLSAEGLRGSAQAVRDLLKFFVMKTSKQQFLQSLSEKTAPRWDIDEAREEPDRLLIEAVPPDSPLRGALELLAADGAVDFSAVELNDYEVRELCERRRALEGQDAIGTTECPREKQKLGAMAGAVLRSDLEKWSEHLEAAFRRLHQDRPELEKRFKVFVYGHTHRAERPREPLDEWAVAVANTGAWQRLIGEEELKRLHRNCRGLSYRTLLEKLDLESLPICYSAVIVEPYDSEPRPELKFWTRAGEGLALRDRCDLSVACP